MNAPIEIHLPVKASGAHIVDAKGNLLATGSPNDGTDGKDSAHAVVTLIAAACADCTNCQKPIDGVFNSLFIDVEGHIVCPDCHSGSH